jgi:hypothetical protein
VPKAWTRGVSINNNAFGYYGYVPMARLQPGDTLLRTLWSFNAWGLWGSLDIFPPGSSICRAGLIAWDILDPDVPTPITNASDDWIDLCTVTPIGNITTSTNVDWSYQWATGPGDRDSRVHRKNPGPTGTLNVYVSWEFQVASDAVSGFGVGGWNVACDLYIDTH